MRRIVILGGGYAGLHAFTAVRKRLHALISAGEVILTLVARDPYHTFHGWTGEVLAGQLSVGSTLTKLPTLLGGRYLEGQVLSIDPTEQVVTALTPDGARRELPYDHLLVATGSTDPFNRLPGLRQHGCCLKNSRDMQSLVEQLQNFRGRRIAVVGGGMAGAETASALSRRFADQGNRNVAIELITSGETLFHQLHPRFAALAEQGLAILRKQGIRVRRNARVTSITESGPILEGGELVAADLTVVAAGVEFAPLPGLENLAATQLGRYLADPFLRAAGRKNIWVAGDIAAVASPAGQGTCPMDALWAMKQGDLVGANIARSITGRGLKRFTFRGMGQAAGLGSWDGISELYGITFKGWLAWLIRVSFFAWYMPRRPDGLAVLRSLLKDGAREVLTTVSRRLPNGGVKHAPKAYGLVSPQPQFVDPLLCATGYYDAFMEEVLPEHPSNSYRHGWEAARQQAGT